MLEEIKNIKSEKNNYVNDLQTLGPENFAKKKNVKVAIETEGSFKKKFYLLMQRPEEYQKLFKYFDTKDLGINLNIGHLNLASKAFNFSSAS